MKISVSRSKRPRIEMLPLIDIVFLLLVFFIYAMLSMAVHRGLPVELPISSTTKIEKTAPVSVTLKQDGSIYIDKIRTKLDELEKYLRDLDVMKKNAGVLLFADRSVSYQELFRVMDQIRTAGISRISLQAEVERLH